MSRPNRFAAGSVGNSASRRGSDSFDAILWGDGGSSPTARRLAKVVRNLWNRFVSGLTALFVVFLLALAVPCAGAASKYKVLHSFKGKPDGGGVYAGLALDEKGNLYGMTWGGGAYGYGTVFELAPGSGGKWTEIILHSFCKDFPRCKDGTSSWDTPAVDRKGNLYDDSSAGIFEMIPGLGGWRFKLIYSYGGTRRDLPLDQPEEDDLLLDAAGNLYGSFSVGKYDKGAVTELSPGSGAWTEKDLYSFCPRSGCSDGEWPLYRLTWDPAGNLYGITSYGGTQNFGVAFRLHRTADGWKEHVLYNYTYPAQSSLTFDGSGNLYGTTFQEPPGDGTVYQLSPQDDGHWKRTNIYDFPHSGKMEEPPTPQ